MFWLILLVPLVCWLLAARAPRTRWRVGAVLAVLTVAELGVAYGGWRVRHFQHSLEVLMIAAGVVVLLAGLIWDWADTDGGGVQHWIARVLGGLYGVLALFVLLYFVLGDLGVFAEDPAYGGKAVATPDAELLLPLPAGLTVADHTTSCSNTRSYCMRTFAIAAADGTPDDQVAGRLLAHLGDSGGWTFGSAGEERLADWSGTRWRACRTAGWWLDRQNENVSVFAFTPGIPHNRFAPARAAVTVEFMFSHTQVCE
ncbi:hypothetical protein [Nocardia sp. NBC_01009]|uniref:hypothetical protein n=1 Tax=Nocardia sp. NBC_01009 TaxID=2975996 RepID=UPI00386ACF29|nr:hypothetical protein OHA42_17605 [Nocardia sp. NBC_01009]